MSGRAIAVLLVAVLASACDRFESPPAPAPAPPPPAAPEPPPIEGPEEALVAASPAVFPAFIDSGDRETLRLALRRSLGWLRRQPADRSWAFGRRQVTAAELADSLDLFVGWLDQDLAPEELAKRLGEVFEPLASVGSDRRGRMLVTGYYEPLIAGSLRRRRGYDVPIYRRPKDLISVSLGQFSDEWQGRRIAGRLEGRRLVPYPDRQELRQDPGRLPTLAWAQDRVDLFFVEVQGSGLLQLPDGREIGIGYHGSNGRRYRSIGRLLIDEGKVPREKMSMQAIRAYLSAHPEEIDRVLDYNQSVVFFRKLDGPPVGSLGLPVTPERTIATDRKLFPPAALAFLHTEIPMIGEDGSTESAGVLGRFVLNQDTGGAIKGPGRVDFFWGRGDDAALRAGLMKQPGRLFFLVPKSATR